MAKKIKKLKKKNIFIFILLIITTITILIYTYNKVFITAPIPSIEEVTINNDNELIIKYKVAKHKKNKDIYCLFKTEEKTPTPEDKNWELAKDDACSKKIDDNIYYAYLKNNDNEIIAVIEASKQGKVTSLTTNKDKIYIAENGTYTLKATFEKIGNIEEKITWNSLDETIATVDENGTVTGHKKGTTKIVAEIKGVKKEIETTVTTLITSKILKTGFDFSKPELECKQYTKEENDLIDEILKDRINDAGYKTRAGAVEAARFLVLEFPYKLSYFYENGRQTTNNVDGEGRYYHVGFYLHESRNSSLTGSATGPKTWGCPLYSRPAYRNIDNGLDCSGYVSWALLNAGFDVKDVGAGFSDNLDLTDYGELKSLTTSLINSNKIKVGDLVHSYHSGGHIGMIIGIDEKYFYVAQALWNDASHSLTKKNPNVMAVQITNYTYSEIKNIFPHVVLMDKYYKEDGNLTVMW